MLSSDLGPPLAVGKYAFQLGFGHCYLGRSRYQGLGWIGESYTYRVYFRYVNKINEKYMQALRLRLKNFGVS